jgi:hypothetical protein
MGGCDKKGHRQTITAPDIALLTGTGRFREAAMFGFYTTVTSAFDRYSQAQSFKYINGSVCFNGYPHQNFIEMIATMEFFDFDFA